MNKELDDVLQHFGVKGMKWGVHKRKDDINSTDRVIKKGTEIQNISGNKLTDKKRHMYASYTSFDKDSYVTVMNFMYGDNVYKNEFTVKKDIKVPSDKKLVEEFKSLAKQNPKEVADDMANAYNQIHKFRKKTSKHFEKKLSKIDGDYSKKGEKTTKEFVQLMVSDESAKTRGKFFGSLIKKGYDGMSDANDRDGGAQDPLIIFNTSKNLKTGKSVKLTSEELKSYYMKVSFDEKFQKEGKNLAEVQHNQEVRSMKQELEDVLQHYGVKGMHWGKHKANVSAGVKKVGGTTKEVASKAASKVASKAKPHIDSIKRERSWKKKLNEASGMSTKDIQKLSSRAQLENDMKRLSKKPEVGSSKDKKDYLKRADMSDQELHRKVQRLRAKENFSRNANDATKRQKEIAKKVLQIAAPLVLTAVMNGGKLGKKDLVNTAMNLGGPKAKAIKAVVDAVKKKTKHGIEDEETLQHHGVKGMHWGVRKKVQKMVKNRRAKQNKRVLDSHEKLNTKNKTYKKLYAYNSKRYKTHLAAARKSQIQLGQLRKQKVGLAISVAGLAAPHLAPHIAKATNAAAKAARNPENIRRAKNVVQTLKRSSIRYVDGKAMKNVIN